jgi:hypothetical protein
MEEDDDRCLNSDRQRNEIKTNDNLFLTGRFGESMTMSWNFKLDSDFLPPYSFCHIHQMKAVGGDDSMPLLTITARKSTPDELQLLQYDWEGELIFLASAPLEPLIIFQKHTSQFYCFIAWIFFAF